MRIVGVEEMRVLRPAGTDPGPAGNSPNTHKRDPTRRLRTTALKVARASMTSGQNVYKKGCQEKKLRLERRRDFFLEIQPTEVSTSLEKFGLLFILVSFSAAGDAAVEFKRAASELVASEATMVLSEARGLWLFLVIREGIT